MSILTDLKSAQKSIKTTIGELQFQGKLAAGRYNQYATQSSRLALGNIKKSSDLTIESFANQALLNEIGGRVEANAYSSQASALRQAAYQVSQSTGYNLNIDNLNTKRQLDSLKRQKAQVLGKSLVQTSARNINLGSKSAVALAQANAEEFSTAIRDTSFNQEAQARAALYESEIKRTNLLNQAQAADFKSTVTGITTYLTTQNILKKKEAAEIKGAYDIYRARLPRSTARATLGRKVLSTAKEAVKKSSSKKSGKGGKK